MTEHEKRSLQYRLARRFDADPRRIMEIIREEIKKSPLTEEPPKGEWERVSGGSFIDVYRCSKCKHEPPRKPLPDIKTWGWDFTDFCPKCGADMRAESEDK